jgi:GT2 family glycosyltransferase
LRTTNEEWARPCNPLPRVGTACITGRNEIIAIVHSIRCRFVDPGQHADVAAVVVTYNSADAVDNLLADLRRETASVALRVVVVDNDSTDGTADIVAKHGDVQLIRSGGNLGYAGGINRARPHLRPCTTVMVLNPDLRLREGSITAMRNALVLPDVGLVVPLSLHDGGSQLDLTLRREPTILGALVDALIGGRRVSGRPRWLTETELQRDRYQTAHAVEWATGAAMLIRADVEQAVGDWDESYFLYSEETDYCRRIRDSGHHVWFEPKAVVEHKGAGSGTSSAQSRLMAVNRVRYVERHHGRLYAATYRWVAALSEALRARDPVHRQTLSTLLRRDRWRELPSATVATPQPHAADR